MERDSLYRYKAHKYRQKYLALKRDLEQRGGLPAVGLLRAIAPDLPERVRSIGEKFGVDLPVSEMEQLNATLEDYPELRDELMDRTIPFCLSDADYKRVKYCIVIATDVVAVIGAGTGIPKLLRDLVRHPRQTFAYLTQVVIPIVKGQTQKSRPVFEDNLNVFLGETLNIDTDQLQQLSFEELREMVGQRVTVP